MFSSTEDFSDHDHSACTLHPKGDPTRAIRMPHAQPEEFLCNDSMKSSPGQFSDMHMYDDMYESKRHDVVTQESLQQCLHLRSSSLACSMDSYGIPATHVSYIDHSPRDESTHHTASPHGSSSPTRHPTPTSTRTNSPRHHHLIFPAHHNMYSQNSTQQPFPFDITCSDSHSDRDTESGGEESRDNSDTRNRRSPLGVSSWSMSVASGWELNHPSREVSRELEQTTKVSPPTTSATDERVQHFPKGRKKTRAGVSKSHFPAPAAAVLEMQSRVSQMSCSELVQRLAVPACLAGGWEALEAAAFVETEQRTGKGGRQPKADPHTDASIDPRKAARIIANRASAARSKQKQRNSAAIAKALVKCAEFKAFACKQEMQILEVSTQRLDAESTDLDSTIAILQAEVQKAEDLRAALMCHLRMDRTNNQ